MNYFLFIYPFIDPSSNSSGKQLFQALVVDAGDSRLKTLHSFNSFIQRGKMLEIKFPNEFN